MGGSLLNTVTQGDCLKLLPQVASGSVDMVLCDLPYGITRNPWDSVVPLPELWEQIDRVLKRTGTVALTSVFPFTGVLACSRPSWFRYSLVWEKNISTGFLNAKSKPLRKHEDILIFQPPKGTPIYNPQLASGAPYVGNRRGYIGETYDGGYPGSHTLNGGTRYPTSVLSFAREIGLHPTQKPVLLFAHLIQTYTNSGGVVLDMCCGSGTTGVACLQTGRKFIEFELVPKYCEIARRRVFGGEVAPASTSGSRWKSVLGGENASS